MREASVPERIDAANQNALERLFQADPVLVDVIPATEAIPALVERMILHAGPPIAWGRMCGPMRGAVAGIAMFEGWADDLSQAEELASEGKFAFHPKSSFQRGRPYDRYHDTQSAGAGGREPRLRQSGVLYPQRGSR